MPVIADVPKLWLPPKPAIIRPAREVRCPPVRYRVERAILPGLIPVVSSAEAAPTMSFVGSATSNDASGDFDLHASSAEGDWAIVFDFAMVNSGGPPSEVVPSGWTQIGSSLAGNNSRSVVSHKILDADDASTTFTGMSATTVRLAALTFRPASFSISTVTPSTWNAEATDGNPSSQNVGASGQATPLIVFGFAGVNQGTSVTFSTASPAFDGLVGLVQRHEIGYKIYNSSPADHIIDMNDFGNDNALRSGYVQFS
jgi:hypothetical protein